MFDDPKKELRRLEQELLAEEDYEEEYEEEYDEEYDEDSDDLDLDAIEELLSEETEEDEESEELFTRNYANRYGRGSKKEFDYMPEEEELEDGEYLYRDDYRKAKKKKKKKSSAGWVVIALLEAIAIGAICLWWLSWMR